MKREEAIQILSTRDAHGVLCGYTSGVTEALDMAIEALRTIDNCDQCEWCCPSDGTPTIHIVRCKDCIYRSSCDYGDIADYDEGYCSYGERIEE